MVTCNNGHMDIMPKLLQYTIQDAFDSFEIKSKIVSMCSDNAFNIQNGLQLLKDDGSIVLTGRCMGHMIQLIVNRVINKIKTSKSSIHSNEKQVTSIS